MSRREGGSRTWEFAGKAAGESLLKSLSAGSEPLRGGGGVGGRCWILGDCRGRSRIVASEVPFCRVWAVTRGGGGGGRCRRASWT